MGCWKNQVNNQGILKQICLEKKTKVWTEEQERGFRQKAQLEGMFFWDERLTGWLLRKNLLMLKSILFAKTSGFLDCGWKKAITLPETNIVPENQWLEDVFHFGMAYF